MVYLKSFLVGVAALVSVLSSGVLWALSAGVVDDSHKPSNHGTDGLIA